jgi:hypothetical protein
LEQGESETSHSVRAACKVEGSHRGIFEAGVTGNCKSCKVEGSDRGIFMAGVIGKLFNNLMTNSL